MNVAFSNAIRIMILSSPLDLSKPFWRAYGVAGIILRLYLGDAWFDRHVMPRNATASFLRTGPRDKDEEELHMRRLIDLAEMMYNLRGAQGFPQFLEELRTRSDVQAKMTELLVGKLLRTSSVDFKYVSRTQQAGNDYDIELRLPSGMWAPCETKCKVEGSVLSETSITNSFNDMRKRKQLPKDRPGVVFVEVPQEWYTGVTTIETPPDQWPMTDFKAHSSAAARNLFRNTSRVLHVIFFSDVYIRIADYATRTIVFLDEQVNSQSAFFREHKASPIPPIHQLYKLNNWESLFDLTSPGMMNVAVAQRDWFMSKSLPLPNVFEDTYRYF